MLATAHVTFDRGYFELHYDESLHYRLKFKRYEIWLALGLIAFGLVMAFQFPQQWLVGALFVTAGAYEFIQSATHKRRWVNARLATVRDDKAVELQFDGDSLISTSANGSSIIKLTAFTDFTTGSQGFFLIPDNGISIYVPRSTIDPSDSYSSLIELLRSRIKGTGDGNGG